jgi:hypothetical protein
LVWTCLRRQVRSCTRRRYLIPLLINDNFCPLETVSTKTGICLDGSTTYYSTESTKPGSAASLLRLLQNHRYEWKANASRHTIPKIKRQAGKARKPKFQDPRVSSKLLTSNVVATFKQTVAKLDLEPLSVDEKLKEAQNCINKFSRMCHEEELSDINIAAIMHRTARIAMHESLRKYYPNETIIQTLGHEELLRMLLDMVISRARSFLARVDLTENAIANTQDTSSLFSWKEMESVVSLALYSCAISGISIPEQDIELLSSVIYGTRGKWEVQRMVMVALTLGRYRTKPLQGKLHQALTQQSLLRLGMMSAEELTTILWGFAQASFKPGVEFVNSALAALLPKIHQTPEIGILNCLEALPMLEWTTRIPPLDFILSVAHREKRKGQGGRRALLNSLWEMQRQVEKIAEERQRDKKPQHAPAKIRKESNDQEEMRDLVRKALEKQMERDTASQLARDASLIARSLSSSSPPPPPPSLSLSSSVMIPTIEDEEDEVRRVYKKLLDQDSVSFKKTKILQVGNLLLEAHVTEDGHHSSSVVQPHYEASHLLQESANDDAAGAAALCISMLLARAKEVIPTLRLDQAVRVVRCAGLLRHLNEDLQAAVAFRMQQTLQRALQDLQGLSSEPDSLKLIPSPLVASEFLWSYATLGIGEMLSPGFGRQLVAAVLEWGNHSPDEWSPLIISRMAWSLAALNELDIPLLKVLSLKVMVEMKDDPTVKAALAIGLNDKDVDRRAGGSPHSSTPFTQAGSERDDPERVMLNHLYQAALHLQVVTGQSIDSMGLPAPLLQAGSAAWRDRAKFLTTSAIQRQVGSVLQSLGLHCTLEYRPPGSPIIIDVAVQRYLPGNDREIAIQVAVEVDGPFHYLASHPTRQLGSARLRDALLRHSGWKVVSIPWFEWSSLKSAKEKADYLTARVIPSLANLAASGL